MTQTVVQTLLGLLIAHGLATTASGYGALIYETTPLGFLLLDRARATSGPSN